MALLIHNYAYSPVTATYLYSSFISDYNTLHLQCGRYAPRYSLPASSTPKFIMKWHRYCLEDVGLDRKRFSRKPEKQVKVVGLGSRKNSVLEFCSNSPLIPSSVEFWTMYSGDLGKGQSFQKFTGDVSCPIEGTMDGAMETLLGKPPTYLGSAIVLVAGTIFGADDKEAIKLLKATQSNGGLAVCIITKPFMFEGQRRKNEVEELIAKFTGLANMAIVLESDALLKREAVTLTEALTIANNAILLAVIAVSTLMSDSHIKILDVIPDCSKEVGTSDILNILQHSGKAAVGFGAGYSIKASVERAAFDCPFLSSGLIQGLNDVVICIIASAKIINRKDVEATIRAFRHIAKSNAQIICSSVLEPNLKPNVIVTTIIITGVDRHDTLPKLNFWSQLSLDLLFPFSLLMDAWRSRHTNGELSSYIKEPSYSKETPSSNHRTLRKNTYKQPGDVVSGTTESLEGSPNNDGFRSWLPRTDVHFREKITRTCGHISEDLSRFKIVSDNCGSTIIGGTSGREVGLKVGSMQGFCMLPESTCDCKVPGNCDLARAYLKGTTESDEIAGVSHDKKPTYINQAAEPEIIVLGDSCFKEGSTDKKKHWMAIMESNFVIGTNNPEITLARAERSFLGTQLEDEGRLVHGNQGLDFSAAETLAHVCGDTQKNFEIADCIDDWRFPIGIKPTEQDKNRNKLPSRCQTGQEIQMEKGQEGSTFDEDFSPWNGFVDAGLGAVMDIYNAASTFILKKDTQECRMQGSLSDRAAAMLETERGSKKKWTPIIEMQYRGGIYKGHCQRGLPEGKGHLKYMDDSFYDGLWKNGKRCGTGAFYYSRGDVFQGSWRDDFMHGKGWFYFHNGDRWFADFWKGKANGEGRYYSKHGDVFFGHFRNNWRHGESLYIESDGTRWCEVWDEGILINRTRLE